MKRLAFFTALLTVLAPFLGCERNKPTWQEKPLALSFTYMPFSFDPRKGTDPLTATLHAMLYEGLTYLRPNGTVCPALADHIDLSEDRMTYQFKLKKTFWSDGTPVTARDFERSWKEALDPSFPSKAAHLLYPIRNAKQAKRGACGLDAVGITAVADDLLVVELEKPTPYFLKLTSYSAYFPFHRAQQGAHAYPAPPLVSNGPFRLTLWKEQAEIKLEKNPCFWDAQRVHLHQIEIGITPQEMTATDLFFQKKIDWCGGVISPLPLSMLSALTSESDLQISPMAGTNLCAFNTDQPPFHNRHIRAAFAYAIDRLALVQHVTGALDEVATGLIPPPLHKKKQHLFLPLQTQRQALAHFNAGLAELGLKKSELPPITCHYFQSEIQQKLALALQSQWEETLGVRVLLRSLQIQDFFRLMRARTFQCSLLSWIAQYSDPMNFLERLHPAHPERNYSGWHSSEFQTLLDASNFETPTQRARLLAGAEKLIFDDFPVVPLYHYQLTYLQNPALQEVEISPLGIVHFRHTYFSEQKKPN